MKSNILLFYLVCFVLIIGCKKSNKEQLPKNQNKLVFRLPEIPVMIDSPKEREEYFVKHYWDNFEFTDSSLIYKQNKIEPIFMDFAGALSHTTYSNACIAIKTLMKKAETNIKVYTFISELSKKYFYDSNSPIRNEEYYIPFLESITESDVLDNTHKIRFKHQLSLALKNRQGSTATNFTYTLASGISGQLKDIESEYILLYFNNPDCEECMEVKNQIVASPLFTTLQNQKENNKRKLTILSIYADEELENWMKYLSEYPSNWICGYDKQQKIRKNELYDLKAMPSIYLLDSKKKILLKDTSIEIIDMYLRNK
ncbi:Thioredoxin-like [Bacteroides luti]|uniref:Thioredoxin-like n=1 Tax=Bacteroides luti TaxID=1297750 RepID=A0A1M4U781_9BACE|nr:DUF5106 domain-containing protein [Bacteroides luti]SHE52504.1 Thioredoxin-like [Bacteroides luti]